MQALHSIYQRENSRFIKNAKRRQLISCDDTRSLTSRSVARAVDLKNENKTNSIIASHTRLHYILTAAMHININWNHKSSYAKPVDGGCSKSIQ